MKTKKRKRLKWAYKQEVASFVCDEMEYVYKISSCGSAGWYASVRNHLIGCFEWLKAKPTTKRQAIEACEAHAAERGRK